MKLISVYKKVWLDHSFTVDIELGKYAKHAIEGEIFTATYISIFNNFAEPIRQPLWNVLEKQ